MGKNRIRESLIREITNIIVHEIILKHTNRPESVHFLESEIIEYRSMAEKTSEKYNWNAEEKKDIERKALEMIKKKLVVKYSDVKYSEKEVIGELGKMMDLIG